MYYLMIVTAYLLFYFLTWTYASAEIFSVCDLDLVDYSLQSRAHAVHQDKILRQRVTRSVFNQSLTSMVSFFPVFHMPHECEHCFLF